MRVDLEQFTLTLALSRKRAREAVRYCVETICTPRYGLASSLRIHAYWIPE